MPAKPREIPFREELTFLKAMIAHPKGVGAVAPSSPALARAIARQIDPTIPGKVLELGPGTGVVTEALVERGVDATRVVAVEYDPELARMVAARVPKAQVIVGDAFNLDATLGTQAEPFISAVSGVPLLNFTMRQRHAYVEDVLRRLRTGGAMVQFSYGLTPPVPACRDFSVERVAVIWLNLPPARVWLYRRR